MNQEQAREEIAHRAFTALFKQGYAIAVDDRLVDAVLSDVSLLMTACGAIEVPWCVEHDWPWRRDSLSGCAIGWERFSQAMAVNRDHTDPDCRLEQPARHWRIDG